MVEEELILKVEAAYQDDVGSGKGRLDSKLIRKLNLKSGSVIKIRGEHGNSYALALVWKLRKGDRNKDVIRIDGITRSNASLSVGDRAYVSAIEAKKAKKVTMAPIMDMQRPIVELFMNEDVRDYIKRELQKRPIVSGSLIAIPKFALMGGAIYFKVIKTSPHDIVQIEKDTALEIRPATKQELELAGSQISYEDIGGLKDELERVREMIELPLKHPELFARLGIEPPKGVLLYGPPGTGKTLIARAVANESGANFFSIQGPEIMSKYYGESEAHLRDIFVEAESKGPSIVFIDELDSIVPKRDEVSGEVERRVVAQLLTLLDGLKGRGKVIVIGATNRVDSIDPALRRPGRFDREIMVSIPDRGGRQHILGIHTRGMPLSKDVNLEELAGITHGFVGADLEALAREAAMKTLKRYLPKIDLDDRIPTDVLKNMEVAMKDFRDAFNEVEPSAMREVMVETPVVRWKDIGGLEDTKKLLREAVEWPLQNPERFHDMGIKPPRGVLLYGAPGTGKTLLAKAIATESEANFISIKGPEIMSKWVGESERAVREIFKKARMVAPTIIFLDEIDSLAPRRGIAGDSRASERVVNQLLTEIDGLDVLENMIIIAATNRPDIIDPALIRSGRFDRLIYIGIPKKATRMNIFKVHTAKVPLHGVDLDDLAAISEGYVGSDIENICREAAMNAMRHDKNRVDMADFTHAFENIKPSLEKGLLEFYEEIGRDFAGNIDRPAFVDKKIMEGYS